MNYINLLLQKYGIIACFLSVAIENIGIPFPIEFVYIYGQNMVASGNQSFWILVFILAFAHLIGSIIAYYLGYFGNSFLTNKFAKNAKAQKAKTAIEKWYKKYGDITSFIVRFIGYVRPWSSFFAGFGKQKILPFVIYTFVGSFIFNIIVLNFSGLIIILWSNYEWAKYLISFGFIFFFVGVWFLFPLLKRVFLSKQF